MCRPLSLPVALFPPAVPVSFEQAPVIAAKAFMDNAGWGTDAFELLWLRASGRAGRSLLLILRACLAQKTNLSDGFFKIWKGYGAGSAPHDQLQNLGILHPLDTTEVSHHHRYRSAHAGAATDHDPIARKMLFDPAHGLIQQERFGFGILRKWNPAGDQPIRGLYRILSSDEKQRADLDRQFPRIVDIPDQQILGDQVHNGTSICGTLARSKENLALSRCSRFHVNAILTARRWEPLYKEPAKCQTRP